MTEFATERDPTTKNNSDTDHPNGKQIKLLYSRPANTKHIFYLVFNIIVLLLLGRRRKHLYNACMIEFMFPFFVNTK